MTQLMTDLSLREKTENQNKNLPLIPFYWWKKKAWKGEMK